MNKSQLIDVIASKTGFTKKDSEIAANSFIDAIETALTEGEKVQLIGFGTFEVKERKARTGRNPATGAAIEIPASKYLSFTAGKAIKEKLN